MAWMPEDPAVFVQTSEDLYFRLFDCRDGLAVQQQVRLGDNFAVSVDVHKDGLLVATGHRGFNSSGCVVKLFDIRVLREGNANPLFEYAFSENVVGARWLYLPQRESTQEVIVAASANKAITLIDCDGGTVSQEYASDSFTALSPLQNRDDV